MANQYSLPVREVHLRCVKCGKDYSIRTSNLELYTSEVKAAWTCLVCRPRGIGNSMSAKQLAPAALVTDKATTNLEPKITEDQIRDVLAKLPIPDRWKAELQSRVHPDVSKRSELLLELNAIVDSKTRVREGSVEERREEVKVKCLEVIDKILVS